MIAITVFHQENEVKTLLVKGHAGYAEHGKDIVCAAVSAVTQGLIGALKEMTPGNLQSVAKDGFIRIDLIKEDPLSQVVVQVGLIQLEAIVGSYPQYVKMKWRKL